MDISLEITDRPYSVNLARRLTIGLSAVALLILLYSLAYRWAVLAFAGHLVDGEYSFLSAVQVVVEALTTAGFGGDTDLWRESQALSFLVVVMNLTGVVLVFLAVPAFAVPLFRRAVEFRPPTESDLTNHVVICGHSLMDEIMCEELDAAGIPYLFVDSDPDTVEMLTNRGINAILGDPERISTLKKANVAHARTVVADLSDRTNPTLILSAGRVNPDCKIISVVTNRDAAQHHRFAGADEVVISKQDLGASLGLRAVHTSAELVRDAIGNDIRVAEYLIEEQSPFVGRTIGDIDAFRQIGVTVIGGWFGARFIASPSANITVEENTILLVLGDHDRLEEFGARRLPMHYNGRDRVIICGYGDAGRAAVETVEAADAEACVVDKIGGPRVDVQGDIIGEPTFRRAKLSEARSVLLAVNDDATAIYATILINQIAPETEIIARANDPENVWKLYNAGADYVLSLPAVGGETLAASIIGHDIILTPHDDFAFERFMTLALAGQTLAEADIRNETGCTVVALERDGELVTDIHAHTKIMEDDVLIAVGSEGALDRLHDYAESIERTPATEVAPLPRADDALPSDPPASDDSHPDEPDLDEPDLDEPDLDEPDLDEPNLDETSSDEPPSDVSHADESRSDEPQGESHSDDTHSDKPQSE